jgi:hypothetical protein
MTPAGLRRLAMLDVEWWELGRWHRARSHVSVGAETGRSVICAPGNNVGLKSAPTRARNFVDLWTDAAHKGRPRNEHDACSRAESVCCLPSARHRSPA